MTEPIVRLHIGGREMAITGDPDDVYFATLTGQWAKNRAIEAFVPAHIPADAVCLDIGANIGLTALLLSSQCTHGHVYAFEPVPKNARFLRRNIMLNGVKNCTVIEQAVSDAVTSARFTQYGAQSMTVTERRQPQNTPEIITVTATTLDEFVRRNPELSVDFIKMDVEGSEANVLAGGARLIERDRPEILMEFNPHCMISGHGFDPCRFAHALWDTFDVSQIDNAGSVVPASGGDADGFLLHNMAFHNSVDDILLRLRPGSRVPTVRESAIPLIEGRLRDEVDALRRSTSWRMTAPLRAVADFLKFRKPG
jgi:FkbM family methyltransferase